MPSHFDVSGACVCVSGLRFVLVCFQKLQAHVWGVLEARVCDCVCYVQLVKQITWRQVEKNGNHGGGSPLHPIGGQRFKGSKVFFRNKAIYYTIIRERLACEWGCTSTFSFCIYSYCHFRRVWHKLWKRKVLNGRECQYPCVELSALKRGFGERTGQYIKIKYQSIKRIHKDCRLQGYVRQMTLCLTLNFSLHICGRFNRPLRPPPVMEESPGLCSLEYHFAAWWWLFYGQSLWGNLISVTFKKEKKITVLQKPNEKGNATVTSVCKQINITEFVQMVRSLPNRLQ